MLGKLPTGNQRGTSAVEYAIIIALLSAAILIAVTLLGINVSSPFCEAGKALGSGGNCTSPSGSSTPTASGTATSSGTGASSGGTGSGGTSTGGSGGGSGSGGSGGVNVQDTGSGPTAAPSPTGSNSAGTSRFNTSVIDQDQNKNDLSIRLNLSWFPNDWNNVSYPQRLVIDVTWSPALEVDQVIPGTNGAWEYAQIGPGHIQLIRTGAFDTSGLQPEPEILLKKPATTQVVSASFSAATPNTPTVTASSSTTSIPYS